MHMGGNILANAGSRFIVCLPDPWGLRCAACCTHSVILRLSEVRASRARSMITCALLQSGACLGGLWKMGL